MTDKIIKTIIELIKNELNYEVKEITPLPKSGSSRFYYRVQTNKKSLIAAYNSNIEENNAFFSFTDSFNKLKLNVPNILAVNEGKNCYIQTDLGEKSLFDYVNFCLKNNSFNDETINLYKQSIDNLVDFQIKANNEINYSNAFPTSSFDKNSILDDLNYFKYYFLKIHEQINFNETRLNNDFHKFANYILNAPSNFFMYRDFQSRNIIINDRKTYFIDYQGGRKGPLQYDVVSLLYQVKAQIPDNLKIYLLDHYKQRLSTYIDLEDIEFDKYYKSFVLLRLLQVLGAYGFRGLIQKKSHFIESIPYALNELVKLKDNLYFPFEMNELFYVLNQVENIKYMYNQAENKTLTVTINSFSYKNGGIPNDMSGNGGGHVFDCRALPNPGRHEEYKKMTGEDTDVQIFLSKSDDVNIFHNTTQQIINQSINNYIERNFKNLFVNFGCTGGQHRSVYCAKKCADYIHEFYPQVKIYLNHIAQNKSYVYEPK